ncbi:hypothetical protein PYCCODRAFT_470861 [Trametes coccinea BRFM310]|uniref:Uncharacterized protein n=1 Tax=Trametes coccinea (strain BRFM310) TaxID=1353009 RepID=A0A1Y2IKU8_TRAC3|nr:hypothetical protein PYCCODRAFT_470861 [Trametes coccinea BRFM310]
MATAWERHAGKARRCEATRSTQSQKRAGEVAEATEAGGWLRREQPSCSGELELDVGERTRERAGTAAESEEGSSDEAAERQRPAHPRASFIPNPVTFIPPTAPPPPHSPSAHALRSRSCLGGCVLEQERARRTRTSLQETRVHLYRIGPRRFRHRTLPFRRGSADTETRSWHRPSIYAA